MLIGGVAWITWWGGEIESEEPGGFRLRITAEDVEDRLEQGPAAPSAADTRRGIEIRNHVARFYQDRDHDPAWLRPNGTVTGQVDALLRVLRSAAREGLRPADYRSTELAVFLRDARLLNEYRSEAPDRDDLLDLELTASTAFMEYAADLSQGRVDPRAIDRSWLIEPPRLDLAAALEAAVGSRGVEEVSRLLAPPHPQYEALRNQLALLRRVAPDRGAPKVPEGPPAAPGDAPNPERLASVATRLAHNGYLSQTSAGGPPPVLDDAMGEALRAFQRDRGLSPDGIVGAKTLTELNRPIAELARIITLNMERWRWVPRDMGERRIEVNVAGFQLRLYERDRLVMSMPVVVGKASWRTPFFRDRMERIVLNPYWNVPASIAVQDILPKVRSDPFHLARNRFAVLPTGAGDDPRAVDPAGIDWGNVSTAPFPYRFRQEPGSGNSLGRIKFMFPNQYNIYLHDTPAKHLFGQADRALSHGCIRVQRPLDLATYLLQRHPTWTRHRIRTEITSQRPEGRWIELPEEIPVYIVHWTSFMGEDGRLQFAQDLYGVDAALTEALEERRNRRDETDERAPQEPSRIASVQRPA